MLNDTRCGFRPGRSSTDDISLSSKFLRNVGSMPKTSAYTMSTSRKHNTGFFVRSLLREYGVDGRLLLAVKSLCCCSENCVQSLLHELDLRLRCQHDRQSQPSRRGCHSLKLQDQPFTFCWRFGTASIFSTEYSACTRSVLINDTFRRKQDVKAVFSKSRYRYCFVSIIMRPAGYLRSPHLATEQFEFGKTHAQI